MADTVNLTMDQGSVFSFGFRLWETGTNKTVPRNVISADKFAMQMRDSAGELVLTLSRDNGRIIATDGSNYVIVFLNAGETETVTVDTVYDLEFFPGGDALAAVRVMQGTITIDLEQTKVLS